MSNDYGPHGLQDLSPPDSFCYIQGNAYHNSPCNVDELKANRSDITADISPMMLQAVCMNMLHCTQSHMEGAGAHFQNFL
jgi:hypothetical protein